MSAIKTLCREIVDYAGLFPPAKLPLDEVVANFAKYIQSNDAWMLARLIVPSTRLVELENHQPFLDSQETWKISSLIPSVNADGDAFDHAIQAIDSFNQKYQGKAVVDAVEIKAPNLELVNATINSIPSSLNAFLEIPHHQDPVDLISPIAAGPDHIFAKIRTGGVTADLIPSPQEVARFIARCGDAKAGFKATAGLHHPLRGDYRLTYESDASLGKMFGFINMFVAACFAFSGANDQELLQRILDASSPDQFDINDEHISFEGTSITNDQIGEVRQSCAISFGSCSFQEPTSELFAIQWLGVAN